MNEASQCIYTLICPLTGAATNHCLGHLWIVECPNVHIISLQLVIHYACEHWLISTELYDRIPTMVNSFSQLILSTLDWVLNWLFVFVKVNHFLLLQPLSHHLDVVHLTLFFYRHLNDYWYLLSFSGKGVVPFPTPWCCSYRKGSLQVTFDYGRRNTKLSLVVAQGNKYVFTQLFCYEQDVTQAQFLSGVQLVWIQSFLLLDCLLKLSKFCCILYLNVVCMCRITCRGESLLIMMRRWLSPFPGEWLAASSGVAMLACIYTSLLIDIFLFTSLMLAGLLSQ